MEHDDCQFFYVFPCATTASKRIGQATVWQSTSVDVKEGTKFDSERTTEVGRSLLDAAEVRRMVKHQQAIAIIGNAPPVRFSYPPQARLKHAPLSTREKAWLHTESTSPPQALEIAPTKMLAAATTVSAREPMNTTTGIVTDNRPAFSFGQMLNPKLASFQPEYDPDQITPHNDPNVSDAPERANTKREDE